MTGSVKRRSGGWAFRVDVGADPATGRRCQVSKQGFATRRAAEAAMADVLRTRRPTPSRAAPLTWSLKEFLEQWRLHGDRRDGGGQTRHPRLWVGTGGDGAKYWLQVLTEMKNRGVEDVCIVVCDGFLDYSPEIRRVIYSTNAIESLNARFRRATRARGHFPNEQAALKCLYLVYLVVRSLDPTGTGQARWMNRWKPALNAFAFTFEGRLV